MHEGSRTAIPSARPPGPRRPSDGNRSGGAGTRGGTANRGQRGAGQRRPRRRRTRILRWFTLSLSVLILGTAAAGWLYYQHLNDNIRKGERSSGSSDARKAEPNSAGQIPLNVLLLGSDSRNSDANVALGGARSDRGRKPLADVQMLLHISADRSNASLLSIPRDTRVDIPQCTDPDTKQVYPATNAIINESLSRGGPGCTLATWENLTDIYIDHWIMVDFAGVVSMADAVGGVEVCVQDNIWDRDLKTGTGGSGLKLRAGKQKITGKTALQWLRTRYAFGSDINRAQAQHMYLNSMMRELRSQSIFSDSGKLMDLAEKGTKALTVDDGLDTVLKLYKLGSQLKSVPSNRITSTTMPSLPDPQNPAAHLIPKPGDAEQVFGLLRDDIAFDKADQADGGRPGKGGAGGGETAPDTRQSSSPKTPGPPASPKSGIQVTVLNGTGAQGRAPAPGRASTLARSLVSSGFTQTIAANAPLAQDSTTISYPASQAAQGRSDALAVAKALGVPDSAVKSSPNSSTITLVIGADWRQGTHYPRTAASPTSSPKGVPDSANPLNGSDKTACMDVYDPFVW